ncbi:MAG TPA: type II toxin-antitoxin system RelE/ParE family toxin [Rhizomicrobium sp.]|jgi:hypothetical protein|nr:type II toxin-antitoxin system RelE/ParE family toxin [Rhizomicrobium sp.]
MRIVRTTAFEKSLKRLGASTKDIAKLEETIAADPQAGDVIKGLSGARKIRFTLGGRGKRGGGRAIYVLIVAAEAAYLLLAYSKKDQDDLSEGQTKAIAALIKELKDG